MPDRRFLVIVRAGDDSRHPGWTRAAAGRNWDLVVSYFGKDPLRFRDAADPRIDDPGQKWAGVHALLTRSAFWRAYDYVWFPDDDIAADEGEVNRLFALVEAMDLDLAYPALDWNSHFSYPMTVRWPSFCVRFTNFVELMAPCFKREFLEACVPTFAGTHTGWGLGLVWPHLLGAGVRRCAIIDDVTVTHTRPMGGPAYDGLRERGLSPGQEKRDTLRRHGIPPETAQAITAAIDHSGRFLHGGDPGAVEAMTALMQRDIAQFGAYRKSVAAEQLGKPCPPPAAAALSPQQLGATVSAHLPRT